MKRKFFSMLSVLFASVFFGYLFIASLLPSYFICKRLSADEVGQASKVKSVIFTIGQWKVHIHHWLCSLGIAGLIATTGYYFVNPAVTYGLLGGLTLQGVYCYSDWNRIVFRHKYHPSQKRR